MAADLEWSRRHVACLADEVSAAMSEAAARPSIERIILAEALVANGWDALARLEEGLRSEEGAHERE